MKEFTRMTTPELQAMWCISRQVTKRRAAKLGFKRVLEEKPGGGYRNVYFVPQTYLVEYTTKTTKQETTPVRRWTRDPNCPYCHGNMAIPIPDLNQPSLLHKMAEFPNEWMDKVTNPELHGVYCHKCYPSPPDKFATLKMAINIINGKYGREIGDAILMYLKWRWKTLYDYTDYYVDSLIKDICKEQKEY